MKHTHEEILNALNVITDECFSHTPEGRNYGYDCASCPFGNMAGDCLFTYDAHNPRGWVITKNDKIWRAVDF